MGHRICGVIHQIAGAALKAGITLERWSIVTTSMIEKLTATNELLSDKKSDNRKEVSDVLRLASAQLDTADKSGKLAEKLLKQAKAQGDKESAKYLKFVPLTASATPPATPATPATSSK